MLDQVVAHVLVYIVPVVPDAGSTEVGRQPGHVRRGASFTALRSAPVRSHVDAQFLLPCGGFQRPEHRREESHASDSKTAGILVALLNEPQYSSVISHQRIRKQSLHTECSLMKVALPVSVLGADQHFRPYAPPAR
jgi:hypothetical protein